METAVVSRRGARRWASGHPWIFRSDVVRRPEGAAGACTVIDQRGRPLGLALWSPASEISLRLVTRNEAERLDGAWWIARLSDAIERRRPIEDNANAFRLVHGEGDGIPSLIVDRYDRWLVVQMMSAGLESFRQQIVDALIEVTGARGILGRNDVPLRQKEQLPVGVELLHGEVPDEIEVVEGGVRYLAAPWTGQKTGAFLDQRDNRVFVGGVTRGSSLDCFSYHGSFAMHMARGASSVTALDVSGAALQRARTNFERNGITNVTTLEANAFDFLKDEERRGARYQTIVLDPPAFAKSRAALPAAVRGYKEINLRAMRLLGAGGLLFTASCSFHLQKPLFLEMLESAAADSGRRLCLREIRGQPLDHPEILTIPETAYIKGALVEALD